MLRTRRNSVNLAAGAAVGVFLAAVVAWPASGNVAAMLKAIERAHSLDEAHRESVRLRLTAEELEQVGRALQGTALGGTLARLAEQSKREAETSLRNRSVKAPRPRLVDQGPELARLNQAAAALSSQMNSSTSAVRGRAAGSTRPVTAEMDTALAARAPSDPDAPRIQMLLPVVIEVGGEFTITGLRFGDEPGEVLFGLREPRVAIGTPDISHWSAGRIVGTVPLEVDSYLTQGETNPAVLWVKPRRGGAHMVGREVSLLPLRPRIATVSSETVMPGQEIVVRGSNFGDRQGRVDFEFAGRRVVGEIQGSGWTTTAVRVRLGDLDGLVAMGGRLHLATERGRTTSHPIAFRPMLSTLTFTDGAFHQYTPATFGPDGNRAMTALVHYPELRNRLENQWVVESAVVQRSGDGGCRYDPAPVLGGSQAPIRVVVEADAHEIVSCTSTVTLRGPRNTPYYR